MRNINDIHGSLNQFAPRINIKKIDPRAEILEFNKPGDSGLDLRAILNNSITVIPGQTALIHTGLAIDIRDPRIGAFIFPRSGLGHKHGLVLGNLTGVIDSNYQGEIKISMWNRSDEPYKIIPGERLAQLVFMPILKPIFTEVKRFSDSERGAKGFGDSGRV